MEEKLVVTLHILTGNFQKGFEVNAEIYKEGKEGINLHGNFPGKLPPYNQYPCISNLYEDWLSKYEDIKTLTLRMEAGGGKIEDFNKELISKCCQSAEKFLDAFKTWLTSGDQDFQIFLREMRERFKDKRTEMRVLIQTTDSCLKKLPWHKWDLFKNYKKVEVALCNPKCEKIPEQPSDEKARILAILGGNENIDYESDIESLKKLKGADITFLPKPKHTDLSDNLWQDKWDILFFTGHSDSKYEKGRFQINDTDFMTIQELEKGLSTAIECGLQLAIFNSCDGLKIAEDLADLNIPQVIVMREPVNDEVAQKFLKFFLFAFSGGKSSYLAVRDARERLHENGFDKTIPGSSWLPVIYQNPATIPLEWKWEKGFVESPEASADQTLATMNTNNPFEPIFEHVAKIVGEDSIWSTG